MRKIGVEGGSCQSLLLHTYFTSKIAKNGGGWIPKYKKRRREHSTKLNHIFSRYYKIGIALQQEGMGATSEKFFRTCAGHQ